MQIDGRAGANCGPGTCEDDAAWEVAKRLGDGQRRRERARMSRCGSDLHQVMAPDPAHCGT